MEDHFRQFRENIIGIDQCIKTPVHDSVRIVYTDWTASGRNYKPIEDKIQNEILPFVANTHTDTNHTGMSTTYAYHNAQSIIKKHVNAGENDILISSNSGMTGVINKLQRILGLRIHESYRKRLELRSEEIPVVFITHMEHHSNQTSWLETIADVVIIPPGEDGLVSPQNFERLLGEYRDRPYKIAAISSCSNVTGIMTPYYEIAKIIHRHKGLCFVDFACSAPYVQIDMHPADPESYLDAIYFSPHKFLGGPGSSGILIFNRSLYHNTVPDEPGGGTVDWTNPWGKHKFVDDIQSREDGGTPAFLQTIRVALCMQLKEQMGVKQMLEREEEQIDLLWDALKSIPGLHLLAENHKKRLGIFSFYIDGLHYTAGVKMLNDRFGIQTRGGCSCAGTYGHYLLNVGEDMSNEITDLISKGDCSSKPGWIRMSIHPTTTNEEIAYIIDSIRMLAENHKEWMNDYDFDIIHNRIKAKNTLSDNEVRSHITEIMNADLR